MCRIAVIDIVALTGKLLGNDTPSILEFSKKGSLAAINPAFPALTCSAQANYLTGVYPQTHGIVGNGWYDRDLAEHLFWKQSNKLVQTKKIYDELKETTTNFTCAKLFWWFNMYSNVDYSITPRPIYPADGRKIPDIYTNPYSIRNDITNDIGRFPFQTFWGPLAGKNSKIGSADAASRWIAKAAMWIEEKYKPTLNLIYLPHLDYNLQRHGPNSPLIKEDLKQIDSIVGELIAFFKTKNVSPIILSEYGISEVKKTIFLNRLFRKKGWLAIKDELGTEKLDAGASKAFAISDHQIAHIYINDSSITNEIKDLILQQEGIKSVLNESAKQDRKISHQRAGDLIAVAENDAWFCYYYWFDDNVAPDFARTVDIHRKPGYDPLELFLDESSRFTQTKLALRILQNKLGFRALFDVVSLNPNLIKGSHGGFYTDIIDFPLIITEHHGLLDSKIIESTDVYQIIKNSILNS
ncbi:MAG: alkaline phosphatase family protein [Verrucomicrobiae bacterium]|nr:alkaline phosphatase family protein [Verrucomicrobiae bacterium]